MALGISFFRTKRRRREAILSQVIDKLNTLDYKGVRQFFDTDVEVLNPDGSSVFGIDEFVVQDRATRDIPEKPQIVISDIVHHGDDLLVRGRLDSETSYIGGITFWRVSFDKDRITRVETTRSENTPMAIRKKAAGESF